MKLNKGKELQNGKYRIIDVLGQGGFGITYLALQVKLNRKVAIKEFFMKEHCNRDENSSFVSVPSVGSWELVERFKQKFLKEAGLIASFDNANIIRIHDVFEENGTAYYVMEYLEGKSLKALVDESGALPEDVAVKYIRQVAGALKEVHENNLLHLDVKPANIMLDKKGNAVLIDFGISKHYDEAGHQTSSAGVGISEGYAPIEQYEAGALKTFTPVTDIYALGATLFFLLTGTRPPKASYVYDEGLPPMPETLSATVRKAVESAMQPRRKERPQSVKEFIALLENQDVIVGSEETEVVSDATNLSMGTGKNASNGNAAVEENEIEVEVVETPSVAPEPAPRPQPEENQKKNKFLWIIILLAVICGTVGCFMLFGGGGDVKKDSVKDSSVQQQQIVPAESVVEQTAELVIIGAPDGANVYVDGEYFDKTPLKGATISIGEHAIKVVKEGYETYEKTHTFNSQSAAIDVNIKKSTALLNLSTNPTGASVYVDGYFIGMSNLSGYNVEQGNHTIKVVKEGYDIYEKRYSFDGNSSPITVNLKKSTAMLYLSTNPSGASVYVDGSYIGTSYISGYNVEQGNYKIKVVKEGYETIEKTYTFTSQAAPINLTLSAKPKPQPQNKGIINGHEYVDLGLSVKWATCNVGASKPEEYGSHYAWGETSTKSHYSPDNSVTRGKILNDISGNPTYDVARKEWGSTWRLPTKAEFDELIRQCIWTWTKQNGINGYKVTSKKNGNSIFLPAAGCRDGTSLRYQGAGGYYWSSTSGESNSNGAFGLYFSSGLHLTDYWRCRGNGRSVRPVSK